VLDVCDTEACYYTKTEVIFNCLGANVRLPLLRAVAGLPPADMFASLLITCPWWNPELESQAIASRYSHGQTREFMLCASLWKILWISAIATTSILFCGYQICNGKAAPSPTRYDFSRDIASKLWDSLVTVFPRDNEGVVTWVRFLWESMHQLLNAEEKIKLGSNGCRIEWERGKSVRNRSESLSWI